MTPHTKTCHLSLSILIPILVVFLTTPAYGMWAYIPTEVRILEADLIVTGSIVKQLPNITRDKRAYAVGQIKIDKVLKGDPKLKTASLAWIAPRGGPGIVVSDGPIGYKVGQTGVWVLRYDAAHKVYEAPYPKDRMNLGEARAVAVKLKALEKLVWSKAVNGLQMSSHIEQRDMRNAKVQIKGKPVKAISQASMYVLFKNTGKKPITLVHYRFDKPLDLKFTGPDGKPIAVRMYGPAPAKLPPLSNWNFIPIAPGQTRAVGYGVGLGTLTKAGQYKVDLSYKNKRDGAALGFKNVWKGELAMPTVKFAAPPGK